MVSKEDRSYFRAVVDMDCPDERESCLAGRAWGCSDRGAGLWNTAAGNGRSGNAGTGRRSIAANKFPLSANIFWRSFNLELQAVQPGIETVLLNQFRMCP
jgi:hypothetical protein